MFLVQRNDNSITPLLKWTSCQPFGVFSLLEGKNVYLFKISHSISCFGSETKCTSTQRQAISGAGAREGTPSIAGCWNSRCCWWNCGTTNVSLVHDFFSPKKSSWNQKLWLFRWLLFSRSKVVLASLDGSLQSCQTHFVWSLFRRLQYLSTTVLKDPSRNNSDSSILASLDDDFGSFTWTTWARPTQESFRFEKPKKKPLWKTPAWYKITSELLAILSK